MNYSEPKVLVLVWAVDFELITEYVSVYSYMYIILKFMYMYIIFTITKDSIVSCTFSSTVY